VRVAAESFVPRIVIHAPAAIPGCRLAAFTTPFWLMTGSDPDACTIVNVWPAIVIVPVRPAASGFGAIE